mmetsp:Transcript_18346/g.28796  ORF Transcript_18346/g.28796 Transcript_18346/m.28796 type:complete len:179 (-) Transcript_18346:423-959(-)
MSSLIKHSCSSSAIRTAATATILTAASSSSVIASFFLGPRAQIIQTTDRSVNTQRQDETERIETEKDVKLSASSSQTAARGAAYFFLSSFSAASSGTTRHFSTTTTNNNGNDDDTKTAWQPNQTTSTFTKMQSTCPDLMKAYAQCVISKQNEGVMEQGVCQKEYERLMDCFRMVRSSS